MLVFLIQFLVVFVLGIDTGFYPPLTSHPWYSSILNNCGFQDGKEGLFDIQYCTAVGRFLGDCPSFCGDGSGAPPNGNFCQNPQFYGWLDCTQYYCRASIDGGTYYEESMPYYHSQCGIGQVCNYWSNTVNVGGQCTNVNGDTWFNNIDKPYKGILNGTGEYAHLLRFTYNEIWTIWYYCEGEWSLIPFTNPDFPQFCITPDPNFPRYCRNSKGTCENLCYGKWATDVDVCSDHGTCTILNTCECEPDYYGTECESWDCEPGYYGPKCESWNCYGVPNNNPFVCNEEGECVLPNNCTCNNTEKYIDVDCSETARASLYICESNNTICENVTTSVCEFVEVCTNETINGTIVYICEQVEVCEDIINLVCIIVDKCIHGSCTSPEECLCYTGYYGENCTIPYVCNSINASDPNVCNGHGKCADDDDVCVCDEQYFGDFCQEFASFENVGDWCVEKDCPILNVPKETTEVPNVYDWANTPGGSIHWGTAQSGDSLFMYSGARFNLDWDPLYDELEDIYLPTGELWEYSKPLKQWRFKKTYSSVNLANPYDFHIDNSPGLRVDFGMVGHSTSIYMYGGFRGLYLETLSSPGIYGKIINEKFFFANDFWEYSTTLEQWRLLSGNHLSINSQDIIPATFYKYGHPYNTPGSRGFPNLISFNDDIYLIGGFQEVRIHDMWRYKISTGIWDRMSNSMFISSPTKIVLHQSDTESYLYCYGGNEYYSLSNRRFTAIEHFIIQGGVLLSSFTNYFFRMSMNTYTWELFQGNQFVPIEEVIWPHVHQLDTDPIYGSKGIYSNETTPGSRTLGIQFDYIPTTKSVMWSYKESIYYVEILAVEFLLELFGVNVDHDITIWQFSPTLNQWKYVNGKSEIRATPEIFCCSEEDSFPAARKGTSVWAQDNELFLFGGIVSWQEEGAFLPTTGYTFMSDLWKFVTHTKFQCFGIDNDHPGVCGSHGICASNDTCECTAGWEGDQCKTPICYPECYIHGSCVSTYNCDCDYGYTGDNCSISVCIPDCGIYQNCDEEIRQCECDSGWELITDDPPCMTPLCSPACTAPNTECIAPNTCVCSNGYFELLGSCEPICSSCDPIKEVCASPETCACAPGYSGIECQPVCTPNCDPNAQCTAPNTCVCNSGYSGNGTVCSDSCLCSSIPNSHCYADLICICDTGYYDSDPGSSLVCDPVCSNCNINAQCTAPDTCICKSGYSGDGTQCDPVCDPVCETNEVCSAPDVCQCAPGYSGAPCVTGCGSEGCGPNEICLEESNCICDAGYFNDSGICKPGCYPECGHNEQCVSPDVCLCSSGYMNYGSGCEPTCTDEFTCNPDSEICIDVNVCECKFTHHLNASEVCVENCPGGCLGEHERCVDNSECVCENGYFRDLPEELCKPGCHPYQCLSNSHCCAPDICCCDIGYYKQKQIPGSDSIKCLPDCSTANEGAGCNPQKEICIDVGVCACNDKWGGINCTIPICDPECKGVHEYCGIDLQCHCTSEWSGPECDIPVCDPACSGPGYICASPGECLCGEGYHLDGDVCNPVYLCSEIYSYDSASCSGNGDCIASEICQCDYGYSEIDCSGVICQPQCVNGNCTEPNVCTCKEGWFGETCNMPLCDPLCGIKERCVNEGGVTQCICKPEHWTGENCTIALCNPTCGAHGTCESPNDCVCNFGWGGALCDDDSEFVNITTTISTYWECLGNFGKCEEQYEALNESCSIGDPPCPHCIDCPICNTTDCPICNTTDCPECPEPPQCNTTDCPECPEPPQCNTTEICITPTLMYLPTESCSEPQRRSIECAWIDGWRSWGCEENVCQDIADQNLPNTIFEASLCRSPEFYGDYFYGGRIANELTVDEYVTLFYWADGSKNMKARIFDFEIKSVKRKRAGYLKICPAKESGKIDHRKCSKCENCYSEYSDVPHFFVLRINRMEELSIVDIYFDGVYSSSTAMQIDFESQYLARFFDYSKQDKYYSFGVYNGFLSNENIKTMFDNRNGYNVNPGELCNSGETEGARTDINERAIQDGTKLKCFGIAHNLDISVCTGHGDCVAIDKCVCDIGYKGIQCSFTNTTCLVNWQIPPDCIREYKCNNIKGSQVGVCGEWSYYFSQRRSHGICGKKEVPGEDEEKGECKCYPRWHGEFCGNELY